nr:hypothetical protein [Candidatus Njordarchaeum guaymaensis]
MSDWIKKELGGGKTYNGGDETASTLRELNTEFKVNFGALNQKVLNVPRAPARRIAEAHDVPFALGRVAYQIQEDGILSADVACELLGREYVRLKATDHAVPTIESIELDFAIKEGQWIEYLFKKFIRQVNDCIATVTTIEGLLTSRDIPIERVFMTIHERNELTRGLIAPVLREWKCSHRGSNASTAALAVTEVILKSPNKSEKAKLALTKKIDEVRTMLKRLQSTLKTVDFTSWSSREMEPVKRMAGDVEESLKEMDSPFELMSEESLAELIVQVILKESARLAPLEKGSYLIVSSPPPKYGELPPLLKDPYDFLERDIKLAKRRDDAHEFLLKTVEKVHKALLDENKSPLDVAINMIMQMYDRFEETNKPNIGELLGKLGSCGHKEQADESKAIEKVDFDSLYRLLSDYFIENFLKS